MTRLLSALAPLLALLPLSPARALPPGFSEVDIPGPWSNLSGLAWDRDDRMYAVERTGRVWLVENGARRGTPFLDIRPEVGGYRDFGLLGFALHPDFPDPPYVYAFYVVDHYDLFRCNAARDNWECQPPQYDPWADEYLQATMGRITRYSANPDDGFRTVRSGSRRVLLGEAPGTGPVILHSSHGTGQLVFGADGTLLASTGDGATWVGADLGSAGDTYWQQALDEGLMRPEDNIGAFRSQSLGSLNGKLLRLDPETGDGVPSNPFYDPADPRSAASRTWALGLRNAYRFTVRPGTGSADPDDADPGTVYLGDVGWGDHEELHVIDGPGQNLGWPIYEGLTLSGGYPSANVANPYAPNPLFGENGCSQRFFRFTDLLVQARADGAYGWPNPCDPTRQIPNEIAKFAHKRPPIDWRRDTRVAAFDGAGNAIAPQLGSAQSPARGQVFAGNCSTGGTWYPHADFPPGWRDTYFHADYGAGWIKSFAFDGQNRLVAVQDLLPPDSDVVFVGASPVSGGLYYVKWGDAVRRITFDLGNRPPVAIATADVSLGPSPLTVRFTSSSSDPDGDALTHRWDFGDGATSGERNPQHTFTADGLESFDVRLTVTDAWGATADDSLAITLNATPPQVRLTSPQDGQEYRIDQGPVSLAARAEIADAEDPLADLRCAWVLELHHEDHFHAEPPDTDCQTDVVLDPLGCGDETYSYRLTLTVTDPHGLATERTVEVFPDCTNDAPAAGDDQMAVDRGASATLDPLVNDTDPDGTVDPTTVEIVQPPAHGTVLVDPETGRLTYTHDGTVANADTFTYIVADNDGLFSAEATVRIGARLFPVLAFTRPVSGGIYREQSMTVTWTQDLPGDHPTVAIFVDGAEVHRQPAAVGRSTARFDTPPAGRHDLLAAFLDAEGRGEDTGSAATWFRVVPGATWDADHDGVPDAADEAPADAHACRDLDGDGCDDCHGGADAPEADGDDRDGDGLCDTGDFNGCDPADACRWGEACLATPGGRTCTSLLVRGTAAPKPAPHIRDDAYRGGLAGMACLDVRLPTRTVGGETYDRLGPDLVVELVLDHPRAADLVVKLVGPGGVVVPLVNRPGVAEANDRGDDRPNAANGPSWPKTGVTFRDTAKRSAETMSQAPVCGGLVPCSFRPERGAAPGLARLSQLAGLPAAGPWRMCAGDVQRGASGFLRRATLLAHLVQTVP